MPPKQETFYTITAARASDLEHFFAGSIAVGAGEQSRSRRREPGREAGCEKRAVDEQVRGYAECCTGAVRLRRGFSRDVQPRERARDECEGGVARGARGSRQRTRGRGCGRGTERKKRVADEQVRGYAEGRGSGEKQELPGGGSG